MGQADIIRFVERINGVLSPETINKIGLDIRFFQRERIITPHRLAISLLTAFATARVETLADIHRCFNALFGTTVAYKPFHNQLAKWRFGDFMRSLVAVILEQWVVRVLKADAQSAFGEFKRVVIQDGSSFALKETLSEHFPGRFKSHGPSAVELHVTMELFNDSISRVALTPDTFPERAELPRAETLRGCLLLADRGYFGVDYLRALTLAEASFVIRGYTNMSPLVQAAYGEDGLPCRGLKGKALAECRLPKKGMLDLDVAWGRGDKTLHCRLIVSWNPSTREYRYLVTNLPRQRYTPMQVDQAYGLRWQIELLFKEWKSYANLHAFDTSNPSIAEGLIWAAIGAAMFKRFLAHMTQALKGVEISTRKVAMCAHHVLTDIFQVLASTSSRGMRSAIDAALTYLAANATRAHPARDRRTGRLQSGLWPVMGA